MRCGDTCRTWRTVPARGRGSSGARRAPQRGASRALRRPHGPPPHPRRPVSRPVGKLIGTVQVAFLVNGGFSDRLSTVFPGGRLQKPRVILCGGSREGDVWRAGNEPTTGQRQAPPSSLRAPRALTCAGQSNPARASHFPPAARRLGGLPPRAARSPRSLRRPKLCARTHPSVHRIAATSAGGACARLCTHALALTMPGRCACWRCAPSRYTSSLFTCMHAHARANDTGSLDGED